MKAAFGLRIVLPLAIVAACVDARADTVSRHFDAATVTRLVIESDAGSIRTHRSEDGQIRVDVERRGGDAETLALDFNTDGGTLVVSGRYPKRNRNHDGRIEFDVAVPAHIDLELSTAGGRISVADTDATVKAYTAGGRLDLGRIGGDVDARTSGGSIKLEEAGANVSLHTSGGPINVGNVAGNADVDTSGGSIKIGTVGGEIDARSSGGSIKIDGASGAIRASTSGGNIEASILQQPASDSRLSTSGGSITLNLAENVAVDIQARSNSRDGPVSELELDGVRTTGSSLTGRRNGGGPKITLDGNSVFINRL